MPGAPAVDDDDRVSQPSARLNARLRVYAVINARISMYWMRASSRLRVPNALIFICKHAIAKSEHLPVLMIRVWLFQGRRSAQRWREGRCRWFYFILAALLFEKGRSGIDICSSRRANCCSR
eukprot:3467970-Rhodomonas_salina.1